VLGDGSAFEKPKVLLGTWGVAEDYIFEPSVMCYVQIKVKRNGFWLFLL
jgi:hypothetical protein